MWTSNGSCDTCHRRKYRKLWKKTKVKSNLGRNQNRLPGERIIRISPDDHNKKLNKKLCEIIPKTKNNTAWHIPEPKTNPKL